MTDAQKMDEAERIARRCEQYASNMVVSLDNIEDALSSIGRGLHRCGATGAGMDRGARGIETDLAVLQDSVPRLPRTLPLLWLALAASVAGLILRAVG